MNKSYNTILEESEIIYEDKKSKFISRAKPVLTEKDALLYIDHIKEKHKDATHNVFAYSVNEGVLLQRFSDDGEPSGTSGKPTLESITRLKVVNLVVVTTRYFGGTLLGTAGLIRAYGRSSQLAIEKAQILKMVYRTRIRLIFEYTFLGRIKNLITKLHYIIEGISYNTDVEVIVLVPKRDIEKFVTEVINETNDGVLWEKLEEICIADK